MTIHEMMHQVALLGRGHYSKQGNESTIELRVPGHRRQVIRGRMEQVDGEPIGILSAAVGELTADVDPIKLLELNQHLRFSRVAVQPEKRIVIIATVELERTSVRECAPVIQEVVSIADELERVLFDHDVA